LTVKSDFKTFVKESLYAARYYHLYRAFKSPPGARLLVLMYHDILDDARSRDPGELDDESPNAHQFDAHLGEIVRHFPIVSLAEGVTRLRTGTLPGDAVSITFDDGYRSVYTVALPILEKYRAPATVFLLTDWIDKGTPYWWHRVRDMIRQSSVQRLPTGGLRGIVDGNPQAIVEGPFDTRVRRRLAGMVESTLRDMREEDRAGRIERLEELLFPGGAYAPGERGALTWEQVREMSSCGIDFEAHTCSHINIRHASRDTIERELAGSKRAIETILGFQVTGFAYPYGKDLEAYAEIEMTLKAQGFRWACTAERGVNSSATNPYFLRRGGLPSTSSRALLYRELILQFCAP
jgi:peptidoglycan/xylan/chitin deacetylase (PgdA/CDA1 family)